MRLKLTNNLTHSEVFLVVKDKGATANFFCFDIELPTGMVDGEYTYTLYDDRDSKIASGLLQIGEYQRVIKEYNKKENMKVYNG